MSKRFTETNKWKDAWFRRLPVAYKAFWIYIVDNCDAAGIWDCDIDLASFQVGEPINPSEALTLFGERITVLPNGRWYLNKFISFQYGKLKTSNACHRGVLKILEVNGVGPTKDLPSPYLAPMEGPLEAPIEGAKAKDKDKDKKKEERSAEERCAEDRQFLPPTLAQVKNLATMRGIAIDCAEAFWLEMEGCGWLDSKSRPIRRWEPVLQRSALNWRSADNQRKQQASRYPARPEPGTTPPLPPAEAPKPLGPDFERYLADRPHVVEHAKNWTTYKDLPVSIRDDFSEWRAEQRRLGK